VILAVAFFVVGWDAGIGIKIIAELIIAFVITGAAALALARTAGVRGALGVKGKRPM